jgi:hypothetical protein
MDTKFSRLMPYFCMVPLESSINADADVTSTDTGIQYGVVRPETMVCHVQRMIETKFQQLHKRFRGHQIKRL